MLIAGLYVGLGTLLVLALAIRVMWLRNVHAVGIGAAGHEDLSRAIRAHANAVEYLPLALLMLVLLAFEQTRPALLHGFGIALIVARVLHALGLSSSAGRSFGRMAGAGLTVLTMLVMAVLLLARFV
ncbi:MAG: hypothetical protein EPN38_00765 [Rhodanobacteraceae bacterium]|nr:MAG: hypothetical protein EPN38_00765 [Rhodanobacteraceae bacterium]